MKTVDMKTLKEKIAVMQAFADGREIEYYYPSTEKWYKTKDPVWDWNTNDYRVKESPEYIPFTFEDAEFLIGKVVKSKDEDWIEMLIFFDKDYASNITYEALLMDFTFLDGSPCGKLKQ